MVQQGKDGKKELREGRMERRKMEKDGRAEQREGRKSKRTSEGWSSRRVKRGKRKGMDYCITLVLEKWMVKQGKEDVGEKESDRGESKHY